MLFQIGWTAVGYLMEGLHGTGSLRTQQVQIARRMKREEKQARAPNLAGVSARSEKRDLRGFVRAFAQEADLPEQLHTPNVKRVPTLFVTNWSGMHRRMAWMKSVPEQCIGMMMSGFSASSSVTVRSIYSSGAVTR